MLPGPELLPERRQRPLPAWEEAQELEPLPHKPTRHERRLDGGRARQHGHLHPGLERCVDQPGPRVADSRHACVGHERDPLAGLEPWQHFGRPLGLVVLVVAEQPCLDAVPFEQAARVAGVLTEDDVRAPQLLEDTQRDVVEVPDRRRADRERHDA